MPSRPRSFGNYDQRRPRGGYGSADRYRGQNSANGYRWVWRRDWRDYGTSRERYPRDYDARDYRSYSVDSFPRRTWRSLSDRRAWRSAQSYPRY